MREVFVVTHGDKEKGKPDPGMTEKGFAQVATLRHLLPAEPSAVVLGSGRRHRDVAVALKLIPTRVTPAVGTPDSLEMIGGEQVILLATGDRVPKPNYTGVQDMTPAMIGVVLNLPNNSVICAGRPSLLALGYDAKSASVWKLAVVGQNIIDATPVVEAGVAEEGTV